VGEALVSFLDEKGTPCIVERALIVPPASHIGPLSNEERQQLVQSSLLRSKYEKAVDRESAYEKLNQHVQEMQPQAAPAPSPVSDILFGRTGPRGGRQTQGVLEAATKSAARAIGSELGRQILRGVLGSILGGGRRR
jgi:DNA helicase HerA-like ATPase